jgi:hypothetical protein
MDIFLSKNYLFKVFSLAYLLKITKRKLILSSIYHNMKEKKTSKKIEEAAEKAQKAAGKAAKKITKKAEKVSKAAAKKFDEVSDRVSNAAEELAEEWELKEKFDEGAEKTKQAAT